MSRVIENVVVVVIMMILLGLHGLGLRLDWGNLRDARLVVASSGYSVVKRQGRLGGQGPWRGKRRRRGLEEHGAVVNEEVGCLDVTVDKPIHVEVIEPLEGLLEDALDDILLVDVGSASHREPNQRA
jgi:hypothetical protein